MHYLLVRNAQLEVSWGQSEVMFLAAGEIVCETATEAICDLVVPRPMMLPHCRRHYLLTEWKDGLANVHKAIAFANDCLGAPQRGEKAGPAFRPHGWLGTPEATLAYCREYLKRHALPPETLEEWFDRCAEDELRACQIALGVAEEAALASPLSQPHRLELEQQREHLGRLTAQSRAAVVKEKRDDCLRWAFNKSPLALEEGEDRYQFGETYTVFVKLACAREMFAQIRERYSRWRRRSDGIGKEWFMLSAYHWDVAERLLAPPGRGWSPKLATRMVARLDRKVSALLRLSQEESEWVFEQRMK